jgi:hypothetical protein
MPTLGLGLIGVTQAVPESSPILLASFGLLGLIQYGKRKFLKAEDVIREWIENRGKHKRDK